MALGAAVEQAGVEGPIDPREDASVRGLGEGLDLDRKVPREGDFRFREDGVRGGHAPPAANVERIRRLIDLIAEYSSTSRMVPLGRSDMDFETAGPLQVHDLARMACRGGSNSPRTPRCCTWGCVTARIAAIESMGGVAHTHTHPTNQKSHSQGGAGEGAGAGVARGQTARRMADEVSDEASWGRPVLRWNIDAAAAAVLRRAYSVCRFPTREQRAELARELGVTERRVQVWFQNARQREGTDACVPNLDVTRKKRARDAEAAPPAAATPPPSVLSCLLACCYADACPDVDMCAAHDVAWRILVTHEHSTALLLNAVDAHAMLRACNRLLAQTAASTEPPPTEAEQQAALSTAYSEELDVLRLNAMELHARWTAPHRHPTTGLRAYGVRLLDGGAPSRRSTIVAERGAPARRGGPRTRGASRAPCTARRARAGDRGWCRGDEGDRRGQGLGVDARTRDEHGAAVAEENVLARGQHGRDRAAAMLLQEGTRQATIAHAQLAHRRDDGPRLGVEIKGIELHV